MNPYKKILRANLSRLFSLYDLDPCSSTYGCGDRLHWGWKISDFANGTFQGGVHALAIAIRLKLIENPQFGLRVIDSAIKAISGIRARNGSLVEAYPNEHSFCVTSLVAFDVLSAIRHLGAYVRPTETKEYLEIIRPLILFITHNDEKHAIISNHLAAGVGAIELWNELSGEESGRAKELLAIIYRHQSEEGWYQEYEGADLGYQTLCTYYLFSAYEVTGDRELLESLKRNVSFLKYFVHPDGTIGGLYGSRNTEVYYPAGLVGLAPVSEEVALAASLLQKGLLTGNHVLPQDIDIGNFTPLLNAYAVAALHYEKTQKAIEEADYRAPYEGAFSKSFHHSGIYIHSTPHYYAIMNYKKGGTLKVFDKQTGTLDTEDAGILGVLKNGKKFSAQQFNMHQNFTNHTLRASFYTINEAYPTPITCLFLRVLSVTLFRSILLGNLFKHFVVKKLIAGKRKIGGEVLRVFEFLEDKIIVNEEIRKPKACKTIGHFGKCKAIHMASSGYYVRQDQLRPSRSRLVQFRSEG